MHRREPVNLMVKLVNRGSVVAIVRAVDMSSGGMRIETPGLKFQSGEGVAVDFCLPGFPQGVRCCLNAMVIHSEVGSTGLMMSSQSSLHDIFQTDGAGPRFVAGGNRHRL